MDRSPSRSSLSFLVEELPSLLKEPNGVWRERRSCSQPSYRRPHFGANASVLTSRSPLFTIRSFTNHVSVAMNEARGLQLPTVSLLELTSL